MKHKKHLRVQPRHQNDESMATRKSRRYWKSELTNQIPIQIHVFAYGEAFVDSKYYNNLTNNNPNKSFIVNYIICNADFTYDEAKFHE
ncbi:hypothetical protein T11_7478 [Trichinella zimbabwensis]|uniref:Uncharacterized protein n=1 Tax=Trichinella zimbabwensis TaxID=268475 RepID=A0A0V1GS49_9BILA|nr:hypothetical protein T11_7478 [Trichinella zimbabwensis]